VRAGSSRSDPVYQENGVTIRSWPAIHEVDGPVTSALEWSGMKIVIGGDTFLNKWLIKHATGPISRFTNAFRRPTSS
jgi:ribonuclease Z